MMCTTITKKQTVKDMDSKRVVTAYKVVAIGTLGGAQKICALSQGSLYKSGWMKAEEDWSQSGDDWTLRSGGCRADYNRQRLSLYADQAGRQELPGRP